MVEFGMHYAKQNEAEKDIVIRYYSHMKFKMIQQTSEYKKKETESHREQTSSY